MSFVRTLLDTAAATIDRRASDRDLPQERSMAATVKAFNAIYGTDLTESQGWGFMQVLKQVRARTGPYKEDDFVDGAAYVALQAEARKAEDQASRPSAGPFDECRFTSAPPPGFTMINTTMPAVTDTLAEGRD